MKLLKLFKKKPKEEPKLLVQNHNHPPLKKHDINEVNEFLEWRNKLRLGNIDDDTFLQILNTRF